MRWRVAGGDKLYLGWSSTVRLRFSCATPDHQMSCNQPQQEHTCAHTPFSPRSSTLAQSGVVMLPPANSSSRATSTVAFSRSWAGGCVPAQAGAQGPRLAASAGSTEGSGRSLQPGAPSALPLKEKSSNSICSGWRWGVRCCCMEAASLAVHAAGQWVQACRYAGQPPSLLY